MRYGFYLPTRGPTATRDGVLALARLGQQQAEAEKRSFGEWLAATHQTPAALTRFWEVVMVSALSESLDRISVSAARHVLLEGFLAHPDAWKVDLPTVPLNQLYGETLCNWLEQRGSVVRTAAPVASVGFDEVNSTATGVRLRSGEFIAAANIVLAVPHHQVTSLLPQATTWLPFERFESAPITSLHLFFDQPICPLPHAVLIDRLSHWIFAKGKSASGEWYYQVVISASNALRGIPQEETIAMVQRELGEIWPESRSATLLRAKLLNEPRAVFSPTPGLEAIRPLQQSPIGNLQLAGDWTKTGWPATMEGAVRSGYLAATNVLRRLGKNADLVQPGLPVSWLARWLLGF